MNVGDCGNRALNSAKRPLKYMFNKNGPRPPRGPPPPPPPARAGFVQQPCNVNPRRRHRFRLCLKARKCMHPRTPGSGAPQHAPSLPTASASTLSAVPPS
eukprot:7065374-Heterocapsa_arctica.AAC.1